MARVMQPLNLHVGPRDGKGEVATSNGNILKRGNITLAVLGVPMWGGNDAFLNFRNFVGKFFTKCRKFFSKAFYFMEKISIKFFAE